MLANLKKALSAFHKDERGMETLQIVMIVGIAAVILIIMWQFFPGVRRWVSDQFVVITNTQPTDNKSAAEMMM